ncbi:hypothetical protein [Streptomyces sp. NBC_00503]|uniref:hypothetical protein n=1 Tax=Streptomyces sp. NBC_00503 TaxID=2903659 RepID=UPI002E808A29|nr:hypothetical protein [Streptomyces sp. NBC_00503]WUD80385.1 hypothetical protein OG490_07360 [Streptomyces sp. NBC_00503]
MKNEEAYASWKRHKPNTQFAVGQLATLLEENDESADAVFGAYLVAKKDLARSMQELLRATLPPSRPAFAEMRSRVSQSLQERFGDRIPPKYLAVPYDTVANQDLFGLLHEHMGKPVGTDVLRAINADDIHTERRIRELRELGLRIDSVKRDGAGCYLLVSLDLDPTQTQALVAKTIKKSSLPEAEQEKLIASLDA